MLNHIYFLLVLRILFPWCYYCIIDRATMLSIPHSGESSMILYEHLCFSYARWNHENSYGLFMDKLVSNGLELWDFVCFWKYSLMWPTWVTIIWVYGFHSFHHQPKRNFLQSVLSLVWWCASSIQAWYWYGYYYNCQLDCMWCSPWFHIILLYRISMMNKWINASFHSSIYFSI